MQLYHHPYSLDSQKVRMALEEKGIDYTSYHVNPLTGKNMNVAFFRMNPSAKLPVFQNGAHVIYRAFDIIQYLDRLAVHLSGEIVPVNTEVYQWMQKVDSWNPKMFTLTHTPIKYRAFVSKFIRRVLIARMAEAPDLASMYHVKLREAYETEDKLKDPDIMKQSEEELSKLLDDVEAQLNNGKYLAGDEFSPADSVFIPILARITLLDLDEEYINCRPRLLEYYTLVKQRPSYKVAIGKFFGQIVHHAIVCTFALHVYKYLGAGELEQLSLLVSEFQDKSEPGRGRKRKPKSSGNGNMEESLKTKFLPQQWSSHDYFSGEIRTHIFDSLRSSKAGLEEEEKRAKEQWAWEHEGMLKPLSNPQMRLEMEL
uniref:GST N-terminal domain-containing protein n=1 Tax=Oryza barthii TaxID=65489 RepID=A0A0D3FW30_9ORYZ